MSITAGNENKSQMRFQFLFECLSDISIKYKWKILLYIRACNEYGTTSITLNYAKQK